jgi:hypothetical protein
MTTQKVRKDGAKEADLEEEVGWEEESERVQNLLWNLDECCSWRGDQSIAGG